MKKSIKKFLEFNGKTLYVLNADGQYWVALRPICEALGVNYNRQFQNLKMDEILSQLFAEQQMVAADNRLRKMTCLPEKYIYGWLFGIQSSSPDLKKYKLACYDVLYNHFHGIITARRDLLAGKASVENRLNELKSRISGNDVYQEIMDLEAQKKAFTKALSANDTQIINEQLSLFN